VVTVDSESVLITEDRRLGQ